MSQARPALDFEAQVRANILAQPLSPSSDLGTVADLDLPREFLSRLTDRVLRASFYERFRAVVADANAPDRAERQSAASSAPESAAAAIAGATAQVRVEHVQLDADQAAYRSWLAETPPVLASFRVPTMTGACLPADQTEPPVLSDARRIARKHLARDGLLVALARVILALGPAHVRSHADSITLLSSAGIPADLLAFLRPMAVPAECSPQEVIQTLADHFLAGESIDKLLKALRKSTFQPRASLPGFRPTSDSGRDTIQLLRAHATRATYYSGPDDGGNLDLLSHALAALPIAPFVINTEAHNALPLRKALARAAHSAATTILSQPLPVSQWAADNAKPGTVSGHPVHLAPRFASRGEYHPTFIPGDDLAASNLHIRSARSPLLFQGGNILIVDDLPRARRVLLIGEAEIHRNRALGLSAEQILAFFRIEFATDICEVLPAASYHIDQELTVRSSPEQTLAFVPDVVSAAIIIIECSLAAMRDSRRSPVAIVEQALTHFRASRYIEALHLIWSILGSERTSELAYPLSFAESFSTSPADSGVGNLHRFLLALDHLAVAALPPSAIHDPNFAALLRSFQRRAADRSKVRMLLSRLGWRVISVPALPEESRGINPLNGVHTPGDYLMPIYGGLFGSLDQAAASVFQTALGPSVTIRPIPAAESQCRQGALHCSLALYGH